jgi:hypothetical protein
LGIDRQNIDAVLVQQTNDLQKRADPVYQEDGELFHHRAGSLFLDSGARGHAGIGATNYL